MKIYSDSFKTNYGTVVAVVTLDSTLTYKLPESTTILTKELFAILQAQHFSKSDNLRKFLVVIDSVRSLQILSRISYPIGNLIKKELHTLRLGTQVVLL